MRTLRTFTVLPTLPESLKDLDVIARNLFWSWNAEFVELFKRIDNNLWEQCGHNPVKLLSTVSQARLEDLAENEGFLYQLSQATEKLNDYLNVPRWFDKVYSLESKPTIAYFSAEFGIHESLPIYSGGLGILAGDHLKSASDLGVPLVAVGLLYQKGYFRQYLNTDGWQQEHYNENDFYNLPVELVRAETGRPVSVTVQFPGRSVTAQIWKTQVGRVPLYLLDTNIPKNSAHDRTITQTLYGGAEEMRICQEMILGIGGFKALAAVGVEPTVCHMNEGHAAFLALERVSRLRHSGDMTFAEAMEAAKAGNVFTVHTPVAAGSDEFTPELMDKYFSHYYGKLGVNRKEFLALGRVDPNNDNETFKMPVLAIRTSSCRNGVSLLHGEVSRDIWSCLWPKLPKEEIPIKSITNGIHAKTWLSPELSSLYERYLGAKWDDEAIDKSVWVNVDQVPDEEFWRIHQRGKERLVSFVRKTLKRQMQRRGAYHTEFEWAEEALDPETLTIGFARRFATYKRGNLLLKDPGRIRKLLTDTERPIQFIFAGKAHPRDSEGKEIIRQLVHFASGRDVRRRIVFLEDYDIDIARNMVQGVDVWLNNPRRPLEASGTSGMKAAINGVPNMSTLDGWWCEGYTPDSGWIIGAGEEYDDLQYQDDVESRAIFNLLENEIIPMFYSHSKDSFPRKWVKRMKATVKWCAPRFNTSRMVAEYTRKFYNPSDIRWDRLSKDKMTPAKELSAWKSKVKKAWSQLAIEDVDVQVDDGQQVCLLNTKQPELEVGSQLKVAARVRLGNLDPDDISVQIYHGTVDSEGNITDGEVSQMAYQGNGHVQEVSTFAGQIPCRMSGQHGFALRILPRHDDLAEPYEPGMILWESKKK